MRDVVRAGFVAICALISIAVPQAAVGAPITIPSGLNAGDTYFLAFVTDGLHDSASSDILVYDAFVASQAGLEPALSALATTWKAIGSTPSVDAVTHSGVSGPVYNLGGDLIATGSADMFDGALGAPIVYDQFGNISQHHVFTGSDQFGVRHPTQELGGSSGYSNFGYSYLTSSLWMYDDGVIQSARYSVYGISGPLTVPASVPEPSTISLMLLGPLLLLCRTHRRWGHRLSAPSKRPAASR